jgi:hypothetical protein
MSAETVHAQLFTLDVQISGESLVHVRNTDESYTNGDRQRPRTGLDDSAITSYM